MSFIRLAFIRPCAVVLLLIGCSSAGADDWLRFRGPGGAGVSSVAVPTAWSPDANIAWKTELPGAGVSSPIVVGGKVFVTCYSGYGLNREEPGEMKNLMRHLVCVDASTGEKIWQKDIAPALPEDPYAGAGVPAHGYASHTPVSDGERVYVFFGKTGALAFDLDGNQLWQTGLGTESDPSVWGSSSSPIVYEDLVIVTASAESQAIVGLDKATGKEVWRQEATATDNLWGTPMLFSVDGDRTDLVMCVPGEMWGLDPKTGELRWFSEATKAEQSYAGVVSEGDTLYAVTGRGGGTIAIRAGGKGDVTDQNVLWSGSTTGSFASPVVHDGRVYSVASGILTVIDAESGEKLSELRLPTLPGAAGGGRPRGGFGGRSLDYASPIVAGDKLYYLNGKGHMYVFNTGSELDLIRVNQVTSEGETFGGTPAMSDGRLILRSNKHLYCVAPLGDAVPDDKTASLAASPAPAGRGGPQGRGGGGRRGGGGQRGGGFDPSAFFGRLDQNQDGKLTENELSAGPMAGRFAQLDADGDKSVTKEEFQSGARRMFAGGGGGGRGGYGAAKADRPERPQRPAMAK